MDITADPVAVPTPRIAAPLGAAGARTVSLAWTACRGAAAQARWEQLAACASEPNPFFEPWYLLPSLTALDPAGRVELLVVEAGGEWLGLTLRLSKTFVHPTAPSVHLASSEERREFVRLKRLENATDGPFAYPDLAFTLSASDLVTPLGADSRQRSG